MRICFFGSPAFAAEGLKALIEAEDMEVCLVVSQPDRRRNRKKLTPTAVKKLALEHDIPVLTPEKLNRQEVIDKIKAKEPDILVVIAYGQIIGKRLREAFPDHILNIHGSLLPRYRGAAPIQRALLNGDEKTGLTAMLVRKEMDAGEMLAKKEVPIDKEDDLESLSKKMAKASKELLLDTLRNYEDLLSQKEAQDPKLATYADKIDKKEGWLDFNKSAESLVNKVRTFKNWPGAKFTLNSSFYKVHKAHTEKDSSNPKKPGTILQADKNGLFIQTGDGIFVVDEIQPENKKAMDVSSFLNGHSIEVGSSCDLPQERED